MLLLVFYSTSLLPHKPHVLNLTSMIQGPINNDINRTMVKFIVRDLKDRRAKRPRLMNSWLLVFLRRTSRCVNEPLMVMVMVIIIDHAPIILRRSQAGVLRRHSFIPSFHSLDSVPVHWVPSSHSCSPQAHVRSKLCGTLVGSAARPESQSRVVVLI